MSIFFIRFVANISIRIDIIFRFRITVDISVAALREGRRIRVLACHVAVISIADAVRFGPPVARFMP
jgi:hypothetical protein